ncbi:MAG TPA: hypothetical protein VK912_19035 [Longimicrobiales bacterium]|nr:hypothetical protein [Longimicrobiales bacterium]
MRRVRSLSLLLAVAAVACGDQTVAPATRVNEQIALVRQDGDQQIGTVAMALPIRMVVQAQDASGRNKAGVPVTFQVATGDGWVENTEEMLTDENGLVSTVWYLGPRPGANILQARSGTATTGFRASATGLEPGVTYVGTDGLVEMTVGDLPVIVTAPHGGTLTPAAVPVRTDGGAPDAYTADVASAIVDAFASQTSRPTVLVSHLIRDMMDVDRALPGPPVHPVARRTWREYHALLAAARVRLEDGNVRGLIVDVHGHDTGDDAVQLGYLLTPGDLTESDFTLNGSAYMLKSSIRDAARGEVSFARVVRGERSLGGVLDEAGYASVPSPARAAPDGADYLAGTFTTARYGSRDGSLVSAVSLQLPLPVRAPGPQRSAFAMAFATALDAFFDDNIGASLSSR